MFVIMGVLVPFEDLRPIECVGSSYHGHCEVVTSIEDQVVAIDASQVILLNFYFIFQAKIPSAYFLLRRCVVIS